MHIMDHLEAAAIDRHLGIIFASQLELFQLPRTSLYHEVSSLLIYD